MKYVSLFAGIGGFDLALDRLGHTCVYVNEWDKYAAQTYEKNFNKRPDTTDITAVKTSEIPDHDILVGGFPCQAFSIAGRRQGFNETRGTLFFDVARILKDKRPRYFILENVKGLLTHDSGKTFTTILGVLADLGYEFQWQVLNSKNFGVPQNRERVYIVGNLRGEPRPEIFPITGEVGQAPASGDVAGTLQADYYKRDRTGGYVIKEEQGLRVGTLRTHKDGNGFREIKSGISPTLPARARTDGSGQAVIALREVRSDEAKRIRRESMRQGKDFSPRRAKELVARADNNIGTVTASRNRDTLMKHGYRIRLLTPTECERLQGFPDGWTEGVSDTQRYKQLGNAVTVNVIYEVARRLVS